MTNPIHMNLVEEPSIQETAHLDNGDSSTKNAMMCIQTYGKLKFISPMEIFTKSNV